MFIEIIIIVLVTLAVSFIVSTYFNRKILLLISEGKKAKRELKNIKQKKKKRINSKLFNEVRLAKGLSGFQLGIETDISPQSIQCLLTGRRNSRPATVKKVGEHLKIPHNKWYITTKRI